jgi:hypothetical protein
MDLKLQEIKSNLLTQDNLATEYPIFLVQVEYAIYGVDPEFHDDAEEYFYDSCGWNILSEECLEEFVKDGGIYSNAYLVKRWKTVTSCFTEKGAEDYIEANRHNLGKTRIYVDSLYRNAEMIAIRNFLLDKEN